MVCWGFGTSTSPLPWEIAFGSSGYLSNRALLGLRIGFAAVFVLTLLLNWSKYLLRDGLRYFIFLTHQSFCMETVYVCLVAYLTYYAQKAQPPVGAEPLNSDAQAKQPGIVTFAVVLFQVIHPLALFVVVLYWTLDKPFWEACAIKGSEPCNEWPDMMGFFVHGIDCVLLTALYMFGLVPFHPQNSLWFLLYTLAFIIWSLMHFFLKIGVPPESDNVCEDYPLNECPIYKVLDWHKPMAVIKLMVPILLGAVPLMILAYWGLYKLRSCIVQCVTGGKARSVESP